MKSFNHSVLLFFFLFVITENSFAQAPRLLQMQGVLRDSVGNPQEGNFNIRFSILDSTAAGIQLWQQTKSVITNNLGLFTTVLGDVDFFGPIVWSHNAKFMKMELDTGGNNYIDMGTTQMLSVPYALFADSSVSSSDNRWTLSGLNIYNNNSGNVGIGASSPASKLSVKGNMSIGDSLADKTGPQNGLRVQGVTTIGDTGVYLTPVSPSWLQINNNGKLGKHIGGVKYEDITVPGSNSTGVIIHIAAADTGNGCETDIEGSFIVTGNKIILKGTSDSAIVIGNETEARGKGEIFYFQKYEWHEDFIYGRYKKAIGSNLTLVASDSVTGSNSNLKGSSDSTIVIGDHTVFSGRGKEFIGSFRETNGASDFAESTRGSIMRLKGRDSVIGSDMNLKGGSDSAVIIGNRVTVEGKGYRAIGDQIQETLSASDKELTVFTAIDINIAARDSVIGSNSVLRGSSDSAVVTGNNIIGRGTGKKFIGNTVFAKYNPVSPALWSVYDNIVGSDINVSAGNSVIGSRINVNNGKDTTHVTGLEVNNNGADGSTNQWPLLSLMGVTHDGWKNSIGSNLEATAPLSITGSRFQLTGGSDSSKVIGVTVIPQGGGDKFIAFHSDPYAEDAARLINYQKTAIGSDFHLYGKENVIGSNFNLYGNETSTKIIGSATHIYPKANATGTSIAAYCDMITNGGGWSLVSNIAAADTAGGINTSLTGMGNTSTLIGNNIELKGQGASAKGFRFAIDSYMYFFLNSTLDGCEINYNNTNAATARGVVVKSSNQGVNIGGDFDISGGTNNIGLRSVTNGNGAAAIFNGTGGASGLLVPNGNVGIGTSTPASTLDVEGTTQTTNLRMPTGATSGFVLGSDANGNASWVNPTTLPTNETDPQVNSAISNAVPKWNGTALVDGSIIDNGNVGINTTTPSEKLQVNGNILTLGGKYSSKDTTSGTELDGVYGPGGADWTMHLPGGDLKAAVKVSQGDASCQLRMSGIVRDNSIRLDTALTTFTAPIVKFKYHTSKFAIDVTDDDPELEMDAYRPSTGLYDPFVIRFDTLLNNFKVTAEDPSSGNDATLIFDPARKNISTPGSIEVTDGIKTDSIKSRTGGVIEVKAPGMKFCNPQELYDNCIKFSLAQSKPPSIIIPWIYFPGFNENYRMGWDSTAILFTQSAYDSLTGNSCKIILDPVNKKVITPGKLESFGGIETDTISSPSGTTSFGNPVTVPGFNFPTLANPGYVLSCNNPNGNAIWINPTTITFTGDSTLQANFDAGIAVLTQHDSSTDALFNAFQSQADQAIAQLTQHDSSTDALFNAFQAEANAAIALLSQHDTADDALFNSFQSQTNAAVAALTAHVSADSSARVSGDSANQAAFNAFQSQTNAAVALLTAHITADSSARVSEDSTLQDNLNAEIAARIAADVHVSYEAGVQPVTPIPNNVLTTIIYGTPSFNDGGAYNPGTGIFTAPATGKYHFDASVMWQAVAAGPQYNMLLNVNGVAKKTTYNTFNFGQDFNQSLTIDLSLNAGDQVKVTVLHNSAAPKNILGGLTACTFSGHQLY